MPLDLPEDTPEQKLSAQAEAVGMIVAQYYNALVRGGVPPKLAADLTKTYNLVLTNKIYGQIRPIPSES